MVDTRNLKREIRMLEKILRNEIAECQINSKYRREKDGKAYCIFYNFFKKYMERDIPCPYRGKKNN